MEKLTYTPAVKKWLTELEAADKREKTWRKDARSIVEIYEAGKKEQNPFNILFSNTETLAPALFNNTPRPVVERRHKDADAIGKVASNVTKRTLDYLLDANDSDYSSFTDMMQSAVLEALLPGRGLTRFKYDAAISGEGDASKVDSELVCGEEVPWDRIRLGYAKKWKDLPWLAFEHFMNRDEVKAHFKDMEGKVQYTIVPGKEDDEEGESDAKADADDNGALLAQIFEIWDKTTGKVYFVSPGCAEVLKESEVPLKLSGFFPCPRPLQFIQKVSTLVPTPLYALYENQAEELNKCSVRINKIMNALKVRGFYDGSLQGLTELMQSGDNTLLPAENVASMVQGQTLDKAIWLFPIEKLVGVLQQLYVQREQIKATIYEITGVSDILRGSSVASETATAQNIKNQWGTLRLKKAQKEVMRYVRDCLRIMAEIAVENLDPKTLSAMTGLQYPTAEEKQQAQAAMQQLQQQQALQAQMAPGQPPQENPQMAQLQQVLSLPSWDEILQVLKDDVQRQYRIDIETNSTVDAEATEDKTDVAEFLNSMSQFLNGVQPMIESGYMSFDVAKTMLLAIVRRFRFGVEVEDQINQMQAPPPKEEGDDPKVKAEQMKLQMESKAMEAEAAHKEKMMQLEYQSAQMEMELKREEMDLKREEMQFKREQAAQQHQMDLQGMQEKAIFDSQQRALKAQQAEQAAMTPPQPEGTPNANV
jgi:hypothetical protein